MSRSIFSGLSLRRASGRIAVTFPKAIHGIRHAQQVATQHGFAVRDEGDTWALEFDAEVPYPRPAKAFFAELNDLPAPFPDCASERLSAASPVVSCIVVVNENLPFVREQLLPSIAACSGTHPIEVILVCNGRPGAMPDGLKSLRSEWGSVSKAYNAGAAAARAPLLAFFHDDCVVLDPLWIEKCVQRLERGAHVVAAEFRRIEEIAGVPVPPLPVAKSVPLVLRRADFLEAGGYDERHYIGYEDLDFTLALARRGKKLVATDLDVRHFHGMSSTLKYHPVEGLADLYAFNAVPRFAVMRRFREPWVGDAHDERIHWLRVATDAQLLYVLRKYPEFLGSALGPACDALERRIRMHCPEGPDAAVARLRELDRPDRERAAS